MGNPGTCRAQLMDLANKEGTMLGNRKEEWTLGKQLTVPAKKIKKIILQIGEAVKSNNSYYVLRH